MSKKKDKPSTPEPSEPPESLFGAFADVAAGLAGTAADALRGPLADLAVDVRSAVHKRAAEGIQKSVGHGLKAAAGFLCPSLRLLVRTPEALDMAARMLAEEDNADWTILAADAKERYRAAVEAVVHGLERYLLS